MTAIQESAAMKTLVFEIYEGETLLRAERLSRDVIKIGRLPSSHLRLDDADVSRMHAVIESSPEGVFVIDLGSASGTILNGQKINKAELTDGAELTIGGLRVRVSIETSVAAMPPPPVAAMPNPFAAPVAPPPMAAVASPTDIAGEPEVRWGVVASGPPVSADEVETTEDTVEVLLLWGDNVLHVAHVEPTGDFVIGDEKDVDFLVGADLLGSTRLAVVDGGRIVVPAGAIVAGEDVARTSTTAAATGEVEFAIGELHLRVRSVRKGKRIAGGTTIDRRPFAYVGGVLGLAAVMLTLFSLLPPKSSALSMENINQDSRLVAYLMEPPVTEFDEPEIEPTEPDAASGGEGERHEGETGAMGDREAPQADRRYAVQGPQDNQDPHLAQENREEMAQTAGVLGTLRTMVGTWNTPTSPFGRESALGQDPMNALGHLMGSDIGDAFGFGGLGPVGTGRGAGGTGQGTIGLDTLGNTLGHGGGCRSGEQCREGSGYGRLGGDSGLRNHRSRVPTISRGTIETRGSLSREVIQRVVRRHHNEVRFCYEQALNAQPNLAGRVTTRFIISSSGAVQTALVSSSTLGHQTTERCITSAVQRWAFPAPDGGGVVSVTYPFVLQSTN